ncbi:STAS domain-containing protein [Streptomyces leeuwenhoekii]|uniref:Anti-sigma factor antagonist n=1 Tax=Streptomyces leeuwenhoekii TaxID=1437453 RepID=A0A0F7VQ52_STRLW|nr:STAS domain-containing protein [Streptomyces leeuwenhoekii]CQR59512.1 Anti-Sigma Factor Antagonist [Streptomyces leeuwenhoekii]
MSQARLSVSRYTTPDGVHVVVLAGDIDHTTAGTFRQALTAPDGSAPRAVVDFGDVTFMDSSGINVLVAANNTARSRDGWLRLARTPTPVLALLRIVGLDDVAPLYPTVEDAFAPQLAT